MTNKENTSFEPREKEYKGRLKIIDLHMHGGESGATGIEFTDYDFSDICSDRVIVSGRRLTLQE